MTDDDVDDDTMMIVVMMAMMIVKMMTPMLPTQQGRAYLDVMLTGIHYAALNTVFHPTSE